MNYKKTVYSQPVEVDFVKCDFPGCTKQVTKSNAIENSYWHSYKKRDFCRNHFKVGKFLINQEVGKLWVIHNVENSDKVVGEIISMLPEGYYNVQWYYDGKKLSDPLESYHASVLTLLPFKI